MKSLYIKYRNDDIRCKFSFRPDALSYCWGYAKLVDKKASKEEIVEFCKTCEFWKGDKK